MTQETADRIFELMRDIRLWDAEHDALDHRAVARQIAAEIDTLAAKVKECDDNTDFVEGLREAERAALADTRQSLAVATVKIDALTRERDEARAEVERLRPAAEAWEALESLRPLFNEPIPQDAKTEDKHRRRIESADGKYQTAAARARAAKERKP